MKRNVRVHMADGLEERYRLQIVIRSERSEWYSTRVSDLHLDCNGTACYSGRVSGQRHEQSD